MKSAVVATLAKSFTTRDNASIESIWDFYITKNGTRFFARNYAGKRIECKSRDELKNLYSNFLKYGYVSLEVIQDEEAEIAALSEIKALPAAPVKIAVAA